MKARLIAAGVLASLTIASAAVAQDHRDQQLADQIAASVRSYPQFTIFDDVSGRIDDGVVVLSGKVTMPYKKQDIEQRVARIDGIREMRSEISVLPVSFY